MAIRLPDYYTDQDEYHILWSQLWTTGKFSCESDEMALEWCENNFANVYFFDKVIHWCARINRPTLIEFILKKNLHINENLSFAVILALKYNHIDIVKILVKYISDTKSDVQIINQNRISINYERLVIN
ncbi:hypothetical protein QLL95_gp1271 [Cotonvirus japonicus]|uniref:Ankyrin repeat protein n=1 Tax=Cotonvirus japonicus TaxID=2811091 RepID=A0ABM7NRR3_9VIRU|nr:hypothetical protein QLL95_gp1271 [Cotonvirus japonicus]BCS82852.1 hypothetical protein [Cotonvirus japonicus]